MARSTASGPSRPTTEVSTTALASGEWARSDDARSRAGLYVIDYGLNLFSGPSVFISGPGGDQHEQTDARRVLGGHAARTWFLGPALADTQLTVGAQLRQDRIRTLGLFATEDRQRVATLRADRVNETAAALFVEARSVCQPPPSSTPAGAAVFTATTRAGRRAA